ncbi:MAG: hypothetical protein GVY13_03810 [Alphaproteobacteria bacterium]|nr:hypothetical protein [Alphaproteobacteria bacterium]
MALWAVAAMALFTFGAHGDIVLSSHFGLYAWHAHEMQFGFVGAAVAGFLLTAVPNWTGRPALRGRWLLAVLVLWFAGRAAMLWSADIGAVPAALIDTAFWLVLAVFILVAVTGARNLRNIPVAIAVLAMAAAVAGNHLAQAGISPHRGPLIFGVAVMVMLISLIGGRIVPNFTRNWLAQREADRLPAAFGLFDRVVLALSLAVMAAWVAGIDRAGLAGACLATGLLHIARLARWRPQATLAEPLVWVMHLGYAWVAAGFLMLGLSMLSPAVPESAAIHAWTAGAMGTMILAISTRATLGHTGRALTAGPGTALIYALVSLAALTRVAAPVLPDRFILLIASASSFWIAAFALFLVLYGPALLGPRADESPPA